MRQEIEMNASVRPLQEVGTPADQRDVRRAITKNTDRDNLATSPLSRRSLVYALKTDSAPED